jgi:hypothetical protein
MVQGTKAYGSDQFAVQWNRPDRLLANLGIAAPDLGAHLAHQHERRSRKAGFTEQTLPIGRGVPSAFIAGTTLSRVTATSAAIAISRGIAAGAVIASVAIGSLSRSLGACFLANGAAARLKSLACGLARASACTAASSCVADSLCSSCVSRPRL